MRILIDTNVIMDYIIDRGSFSNNAEEVFELCLKERIPCCIAAHTIPNLFFILRNHLSAEDRRNILLNICRMFTVVAIDSSKLQSALQDTVFKDFEDCLQARCAEDFRADFIVTRNIKDFAGSAIPTIEPCELIAYLSERSR